MSWLTAIRKASKRMAEDAKYNKIVDEIKVSKTGINSIDEALKNLPFSKEMGELHVNNVKWRERVPDLRLGNIRKVLSDLKVNSDVSIPDEIAFKNVLRAKEIPEFKLADLETKISTAKRVHPDLDVHAESGSVLEKQLSEASKAKIETVMGRIKRSVGKTAVAAGVIGAIAVGGNTYENLVKAANERNGCYIVETVDGKTNACKILNRSCGSQSGINPCSNSKTNYVRTNVYLMLQHFLESADTAALADIKTKTGIDIKKETLDTVLNNPEQVTKLVHYHETKYVSQPETFNPCNVAKATSGCVACDPSANVNSVHYVDDSDLPDNCSIKCVTRSSVLEVLVDVATGMGIDLFKTVSDSAGSIFNKKVFFIALAILFVAVIISLFLKFKSRKHVAEPFTVAYSRY